MSKSDTRETKSKKIKSMYNYKGTQPVQITCINCIAYCIIVYLLTTIVQRQNFVIYVKKKEQKEKS